MAQRKISVLEKARDEIAYIAYFIESKGMPDTAKRFVDDCILFFERLGNPKIKHRPCSYIIWNDTAIVVLLSERSLLSLLLIGKMKLSSATLPRRNYW
jgi:hypothetical protein